MEWLEIGRSVVDVVVTLPTVSSHYVFRKLVGSPEYRLNPKMFRTEYQ